MKKGLVLVLALMLAGCASAPKPAPPVKVSAPKARVIAPPVVQPTPNKVIKKRWYDGFRERWLNK